MTTAPLTGTDRIGLRWNENGHSTLGGPLLRLAEDCDVALSDLAGRWSAESVRYPAALPASDLEPIGYFASFPQLATFAVPLVRDEQRLRDFAERSRGDQDGALGTAPLRPPADVLTPAACYHVYPDLRERDLAARTVVTTRNTCFRQEEVVRPLRRQRSFQMREIVCVGAREEVAEFLAEARGEVDAILARLDVEVRWEAATDPFFDPASNPRYLAQKVHPTKYEALYGDLAIASVNMHEDHFGLAYGITRGGTAASSGCVAFGLERWLSALIDRWGTDPAGWPDVAGGRR